MTQSPRRVVITGMGAVTPIGTGNDAVWQSLDAGRSGIDALRSIPPTNDAIGVGAEVRDFEPKKHVKQRKSLKVMARDIQLAVGAAGLAMDDSCLSEASLDPRRFGVNFGSGLIATEHDELAVPVERSFTEAGEFDYRLWGTEGLGAMFPLWMLKYLPNMAACHISIFYDAQGPNNSITVADASGVVAAAEAFRVIRRDMADVFLVGSTDSKLHPLSVARLSMLGLLTADTADPATALKPYDAARAGIVPGEGAAVLAMEELSHAQGRDANILAEVLGSGSGCDPSDLSRSVEIAVGSALRHAGLQAGEIGLLKGSGIGAVADDAAELAGVHRLFGADGPPLVGYKGFVGYTEAAAGGLELVCVLLGQQHGKLIPTLNFTDQSPGDAKVNVLRESVDFPDKPYVVYNLSQGGQCAAMVLRPFGG